MRGKQNTPLDQKWIATFIGFIKLRKKLEDGQPLSSRYGIIRMHYSSIAQIEAQAERERKQLAGERSQRPEELQEYYQLIMEHPYES